MADNPVFNIYFVKLIKKHPCLWNTTLTEYNKRNLTKQAWLEVSKEVKEPVSNCHDRWRNIRGAFLRSLKNTSNDSGANPKKKYYLNEYLDFLLPYIKNKPIPGNFETIYCNEDSEETNNEFEGYTGKQEPEEEEQEEEFQADHQRSQVSSLLTPLLEMTEKNIQGSSQFSSNDRPSIIPNKTYIGGKRTFSQIASTSSNTDDEAFIGWVKNKKERDNNSEEHPNMSFLRSLLPDMMKMTDKQNRRFRQKVIGLMDDILEDADISACHSSTSNVN